MAKSDILIFMHDTRKNSQMGVSLLNMARPQEAILGRK
jgi:hypothetical protein